MKIKLTTYHLSLLFLLVISFLVFLGTIYFISTQKHKVQIVNQMTIVKKSDMFYDYEIKKYPSMVEIINLKEGDKKNIVGISTDTDVINFGILPVGNNSVQKTIGFNKTRKEKTEILLKSFGNISEMVSFSKNNFYLTGNETVSVFLNASDYTKVGNYTGEIDIIVKITKMG